MSIAKNVISENVVIGSWSCMGGVELYHIEYGINVHVYVIANAWYGKKSYHRVKINEGVRPFIKLYGSRLYFDDCIRA